MNDRDNNPAILAFFSAVILGLASLVVYLLRLKPASELHATSDSEKRSPQVFAASENPNPEPPKTSQATTPGSIQSQVSSQDPAPTTYTAQRELLNLSHPQLARIQLLKKSQPNGQPQRATWGVLASFCSSCS